MSFCRYNVKYIYIYIFPALVFANLITCEHTLLGYLYKRTTFKCIFVKYTQVVIEGPSQENGSRQTGGGV